MKKTFYVLLLILLSLNAVFAQYSNSSFNGAWLLDVRGYSPHGGEAQYIIFDGDGLILDIGTFDSNLYSSQGYEGEYSVSEDGSYTGILYDAFGLTNFPFSGQLFSDIQANFIVIMDEETITVDFLKVINESACQGNWNGEFINEETRNIYEVEFIVDENGIIQTITGFSLPVSGRIFYESTLLAGHFHTGESWAYNQIELATGELDGNILYGTYDAEGADNEVSFEFERESIPNENTYKWEITEYGNLNGYDGYYQIMTINDSLNETDFIFEENEYYRWYAYKMSWHDEFQILPENTYLTKINSLEIGDTWDTWSGGPATALVVDTMSISIPLGTYFSYKVEIRLQADPGSINGYNWISYDIGRVKWEYFDESYHLVDFFIFGGSPFNMLQVGNWWCYESCSTGIENNTILQFTDNLKNYPNPFNPETTISYRLAEDSDVEISVYNVKGQKVRTLVNDIFSAGQHSVVWTGDNDLGQKVSSGIYFYKFTTGDYTTTKKMILMK